MPSIGVVSERQGATSLQQRMVSPFHVTCTLVHVEPALLTARKGMKPTFCIFLPALIHYDFSKAVTWSNAYAC